MPIFKPARLVPKRFDGIPTSIDHYILQLYSASTQIAPFELGLNITDKTIVVNFSGDVVSFHSGYSASTATTTQYWIDPIDQVLLEPVGTEPEGYRAIVDWGATGDFELHDGEVATMGPSSAWTFSMEANGAVTHQRGTSNVYLHDGAGTWTPYDLSAIGAVPTLSQVLLASDPTYGRMFLSTPLARVEANVIHSVSGTCSLNLITYGAHRVVMSADSVMTWSTAINQGEWHVKFIGVGATRTISWAPSKWSTLAGVTLPSSIDAGQIIHCSFIEVDGRLCCIHAGLVTNV